MGILSGLGGMHGVYCEGDGCKPGLIERRGRGKISLMVVDRFIEWELFSRVEFIGLCCKL
jgi:hypothetical protein